MFLKSCEGRVTWRETDLPSSVADAGVWRGEQCRHEAVAGARGSAVLARGCSWTSSVSEGPAEAGQHSQRSRVQCSVWWGSPHSWVRGCQPATDGAAAVPGWLLLQRHLSFWLKVSETRGLAPSWLMTWSILSFGGFSTLDCAFLNAPSCKKD